MKKDLILITGAAGTVGRATANTLHHRGYDLYLVDRTEKSLSEVAENIPGAQWQTLDVLDAGSLANLFDKIQERLYGIVLAAGLEGPIGPIEEGDDQGFLDTIHTNTFSVWLGLKHGLRVLKPKKRGTIVALSSISGLAPTALLSPYCASKHAVQGLVKTAARESASSMVRVNAVAPGPIKSVMMDRINDALTQQNINRSDVEKKLPTQRYATPDDVAGMIAFLCSEDSKHCTGATMTVDGGITCH